MERDRQRNKQTDRMRFVLVSSPSLPHPPTHPTQLRAASEDIAAERLTYQQSRAGLDSISQALQKQLHTERAAREAVELDVQKMQASRAELEKKIADMEADARDKQVGWW